MTMNIFTYLSILLMLLIAVPGRLAYGICILIFLILLILSGSLFKKLIYKLGIQEFQVVLLSIFLVSIPFILLILYNIKSSNIVSHSLWSY